MLKPSNRVAVYFIVFGRNHPYSGDSYGGVNIGLVLTDSISSFHILPAHNQNSQNLSLFCEINIASCRSYDLRCV